MTVAGQELAKEFALRDGAELPAANSMGKFAYAIVQATGGGIGLLAFGPICQVIGRKRAFVLVQMLGMAIVPFACLRASFV